MKRGITILFVLCAFFWFQKNQKEFTHNFETLIFYPIEKNFLDFISTKSTFQNVDIFELDSNDDDDFEEDFKKITSLSNIIKQRQPSSTLIQYTFIHHLLLMELDIPPPYKS